MEVKMSGLARKYKKENANIIKMDLKKQDKHSLRDHYKKAASKSDFANRYLTYLSDLIKQIDVKVVEHIIDMFLKTLERNKTIYFIGNGGSAVTASHFANDIGIGTQGNAAKPFKVISLVDNLAVLTAISNDESYDNIFVRQLEAILQPKDVLVALSVSGNSPNVLKAVRYAKVIGAKTIGCTGFDGGTLRKVVDISFHIPTPRGEYGPVEDLFMVLDHLIYSYLRLERNGYL